MTSPILPDRVDPFPTCISVIRSPDVGSSAVSRVSLSKVGGRSFHWDLLPCCSSLWFTSECPDPLSRKARWLDLGGISPATSGSRWWGTPHSVSSRSARDLSIFNNSSFLSSSTNAGCTLSLNCFARSGYPQRTMPVRLSAHSFLYNHIHFSKLFMYKSWHPHVPSSQILIPHMISSTQMASLNIFCRDTRNSFFAFSTGVSDKVPSIALGPSHSPSSTSPSGCSIQERAHTCFQI